MTSWHQRQARVHHDSSQNRRSLQKLYMPGTSNPRHPEPAGLQEESSQIQGTEKSEPVDLKLETK